MPRKPKSQDENPYEIIRGMWESAYVSHFIRLFRKKFGFSFLTAQELEDALILEESVAIADICARLLRYLTDNKSIRIRNFDGFIRNILIQEKANVSCFLTNGTTWWDLTPEEKLGIVKWLIDHVHKEKEEDIAEFLDENYCADDLRGICAGYDAFNNAYWYLDDLRLYREAWKKQNKKEWECVCVSLTDWYCFLKKFRKTTNTQEKELYSYLNFELFPFVEPELLKRSNCDKKGDNFYLLKRESEELEDMLEKKTFLDCNKGLVKAHNFNGTDVNCHEKLNGTNSNVNCLSEDSISTDSKLKTESKAICDGHLNMVETISSVNNSLCTARMDISTSAVSACTSNTCGTTTSTTTCTSAQPSHVLINENNSPSVNVSQCGSTSLTAVLPPERESAPEGSMIIQQTLSDNPGDNCSVTSNKENAPPSSGSRETDIPPMSAMSNMVGSTSTPATTASVQPLPSNMVTKTSFPLETQYMQQQSQLFVFSTELANKAAESCLSGQFPSIIAFHCAQPGTKSFLEKYPLKVQQFNRQNHAVWLNSLATMKQGGRPIKGTMNQFPVGHALPNRFSVPGTQSPMLCSGPCNIHGACSGPRGQSQWQNVIGSNPLGSEGMGDMCSPGGSQSWNTQQQQFVMNPRFISTPQGMNLRQISPSGSTMLPCGSNMISNVSGGSGMGGIPMIQGGPSTLTGYDAVRENTLYLRTLNPQGVKIPDENLTPEQRQHRVEQLATIRKMQQMLFPEQQQMQGEMICPVPNMGPGGMVPHGSQTRFGPGGEMCVPAGIDPCFSPHQACLNEHDHSHTPTEMFVGPGMMNPNFHPQTHGPVSVAAQMKWQELQHQFYEEKRKKPHCNTPLNHQTDISQHQTSPLPQQQLQTQSQVIQHPPQAHTPLQQQSLNSPGPSMGLSPGARIQGPPPPYHQTTRRSMPSPHPSSPNPSTLSLPSPRMVSGLPSPADTSRQFPHPTPPGPRLPHPSPGAPASAGSSSLHTTPINSPKPLNSSSGPGSNSASLTKTPTTPSNAASTPNGTPTGPCLNTLTNSGPSTPGGQCVSSRKQSSSCSDVLETGSVQPPLNASADFSSNPGTVLTTNSSQDDMFCQSSHQCVQSTQKLANCGGHTTCHKEPTSLMPVPSPQRIEYLNEFDGQELTIQKQPNQGMQTTMTINNSSSQPQFQSPDTSSFPNTPGSCPALENSQDSLSGRYPASAPASMEGMQRFTVLSPQLSSFDTNRHMIPSQNTDSNIPRFPNNSGMDEMRLPVSGEITHACVDESSGRFPVQLQQGPMFNSMPANGVDSLRFQTNGGEALQRFRSPNSHGPASIEMVNTRFAGSSPHVQSVDNLVHSNHFNIRSESVTSQSFSSPSQTITSNSSPCLSGSFPSEDNISHSHLHNLQKMTPPFDGVIGNKVSADGSSPVAQCQTIPSHNNTNNSTIVPYGNSSPMQPSSQVGPSHRLTHFDPIASMAAMSETTVPLVTAVGSGSNSQSMITSHLNISSGHVNESPGNGQGNAMAFSQNMGNRAMLQNSSINTPQNHLNSYTMSQHMSHGLQQMNSGYMNTGMHIQQMNIQNAPTATYTVGSQVSNLNPYAPIHSHSIDYQENNTNTMSCSVTTSHPIMHSSVSSKASNVNMCVSGSRPSHPTFAGQPIAQRNTIPTAASPTMVVRSGVSGGNYNSTNIQVKAGAPNTIQYLPARPQTVGALTNRPATLEFLQRFAAPLTNLDNKVPTHNLQYFPNGRGSNIPPGHGGIPINPSGVVGPGMMSTQRPMNMIMGPMIRGTSPIPHTGNQMFTVGTDISGPESPMFGRSQCPPDSQMIPVNPMASGQSVSMFSNKQIPLPMGGMAPDATQPLPPSMGQTFNYKQAPFYGPTTADPNYAVQFHNFQQQLYATNTRSSQLNSQNNITGQGFFQPK